ncbi:MAG TPA: DMT family transporter [Myxococcales bacterium]|nr:DMT family transporter [Myxococcales bacterium]
MALILALLSAALYGTADFLGGVAARRAPALGVTALAQGVGLVLVAAALPLFPAELPSAIGALWGIGAGVTGAGGVALLYYGFKVGRMSVVAPVTAVCSITIPVLAALGLGERPGPLAVGGILVAIVSVALISRHDDPAAATPVRDRSVAIALASGVAIGAFLVCLARAGSASGLWPLLIARAASTLVLVAAARLANVSLAIPRGASAAVAGCGAIDVLANALYLLAVREGPLGLIATLASLYPASTVLLARVVLGERLRPVQSVGLGCAAAAIVLIAGP